MPLRRFSRKRIYKYVPMKAFELDEFYLNLTIELISYYGKPRRVSVKRSFKKLADYLFQMREQGLPVNKQILEAKIKFSTRMHDNFEQILALYQSYLFYFGFIAGLKINIDGGVQLVRVRGEGEYKQHLVEIENLVRLKQMNKPQPNRYAFNEPHYRAVFHSKELTAYEKIDTICGEEWDRSQIEEWQLVLNIFSVTS